MPVSFYSTGQKLELWIFIIIIIINNFIRVH